MRITRIQFGTRTGLVICASLTPLATAQQISTRANLEFLLDDRIICEDFEGLSVHSGSSIVTANPLNDGTAPASWGMQPGASYSGDDTLVLYGGFAAGEENNILRSSSDLWIYFTHPQAAIGFDRSGGFNQPARIDTITFFNGTDAIGSIDVPYLNGGGFIGWQHSAGITAVRIDIPDSQNATATIDNTTWGFDIAPCPADIADPAGVLDLSDINRFIEQFVDNDDLADLAPPSGVYDLADISAFVDSFMAGCP